MASTKKNSWTAAENALLIEHYSTATIQQLANMFPNHNYDQIRNHAVWLRKNGATIPARKLGPNSNTRNRTWTDNEKAILLQHWNTATEAKLAQLLPGRTMHQCTSQVKKLRQQGANLPKRTIVMAPWWTPEEDAVLVQNWGTMETKLLLKKLPERTLQQCEARVKTLRTNGMRVPVRHPHLAQTQQFRCITKLQASLDDKRPERGINVHRRGRWRSIVQICGKPYCLGYFDNRDDAIAARRQADEIVRQFLAELKSIALDEDIERSNKNWSDKLEEIGQALLELKQDIQQRQLNRTGAQ